MLNGLYLLSPDALKMTYGKTEQERIAKYVHQVAGSQTRDSILANRSILETVDVLLSGWGMPVADKDFLASAPRLKAIFYAAGAVGHFLTPEVIDRGITVVSAQEMNSVPVAEYTLAMILLSLKHTFRLARQVRGGHRYPDRNEVPGCYRTIVGLISYGAVARLLRRLLQHFDVSVKVYDPHLTDDEAAKENVTLTTLEDLFATSDVVSLHTPLLTETHNFITGTHFTSMKFGASFINTSRGAIVREEEMLSVLADRPDIQAVLDVTTIEPPPEHSGLYTLPNVLLTPHIAGSVGNECQRMGRHIADEVERYCRGLPLISAVRSDMVMHTSHRSQHSDSRLQNSALHGAQIIA